MTIQEVQIGQELKSRTRGKGIVIGKTARTLTLKFPSSTAKNTYKSKDAEFKLSDFI